MSDQEYREWLCEGKSLDELKNLLFDGQASPNDVRRALALAPIEIPEANFKLKRGFTDEGLA